MNHSKAPSQLTVGLEEEMFLVDAETLDCLPEMPERFERDAKRQLGRKFQREMIASMIELVTSSHSSIADLRHEAEETRHVIARVAARHGLAVLACGTHPFANWHMQTLTAKERYRAVADSIQLPSVRGHACGLHVHVAVDPEMRMTTMNRVRAKLPIFLALSTSSPFWQGRPSGLKSYRTAVNNEFPRSGLPPPFQTEAEYRSAVAALKEAGIVPDESYLWWAIRLSSSYPTLELRVCDSCTHLDDAMAIAALYRVLVHHEASREPTADGFDPTLEVLIEENRWQASRHGIDARFINPESHRPADVVQSLRDFTASVGPSIDVLDAGESVEHAMHIVATGTSADRQLTVYTERVSCCDSQQAALRAVAQHIASETVAGTLAPA